MDSTESFYDTLAPFYDLIYPDWDQSVVDQGNQLDHIIVSHGGAKRSSVLDVSCGIGTQALGLAKCGHVVTASDLSTKEIERASKEALRMELTIEFSVCDMRAAYDHHQKEFDVVLSADNSIPHLMSDEDILRAFTQFFRCTKPGGLCVITVRDYEREAMESRKIRPYSVQDRNGHRYLMFQVWDVDATTYQVSLYCVEDSGSECRAQVMKTRYNVISIPRLMNLLTAVGFSEVTRLDEGFYQPVIVAKRGKVAVGAKP